MLTVRAVPEIILRGGWAAIFFCPGGGGCYMEICPGGGGEDGRILSWGWWLSHTPRTVSGGVHLHDIRATVDTSWRTNGRQDKFSTSVYR